jgi:hypothetical protein
VTTIAYRDGIIAADNGLCDGGLLQCNMKKIARNESGEIAGACGEASWIFAFLDWFAKPSSNLSPSIPRDKDGNAEAKGFLVRTDGVIRVFNARGFLDVQAPYYSIGSGSLVAVGAMWEGASAMRAVAASIAHDESTWGDIDFFNLGSA